jgi:hypothetical protein
VIVASLLLLPCLARADGGPIIPDPELWAMIDEGQQIAVVRLEQENTARVDLFVSMVDRSGQSHEVTYFLPLGVEARDFGVVGETSLAFDEALTEPIEAQLKVGRREESDYRERVGAALLLGALPAHGAWSWLAAVPYLLGGLRMGGMGAAPVATFETPGSQVSIYDINAATDLQALIETTGLDPKVEETLAALKGQQIAVVRLQTQPAVAEEQEPVYPGESLGQPGIHLGWRSTLVPHLGEATYTYPLGTGQAWASPIEVTRVFVVSPVEVDFRVEYPRLGEDLSGLAGSRYGALAWKVDKATSPAYAVDEGYGDFGHIWRATYIKSNSAQDLVVTRLERVSREMQQAIRRAKVRRVVGGLLWPVCLLAGIAAWVTAWRVVIPRRLGVPYRWRQWRLYGHALAWAGIYIATNLVVLAVAVLPVVMASYAGGCLAGLPFVLALPLPFAALGLANATIYAQTQAVRLQVARGRAFGAYVLAVLTANALYLAFAVGYAAVAGVL